MNFIQTTVMLILWFFAARMLFKTIGELRDLIYPELKQDIKDYFRNLKRRN